MGYVHEANDSEVTSTATRRRVLTGAAGAFVLAASGLLLPAEPRDAEAGEGSAGGKLGGRHGANRRGRSKRRTHGDRKNKDNGLPGRGILRNLKITVQNQSLSDTLTGVLINDRFRKPFKLTPGDLLYDQDIDDDEGWIFLQTVEWFDGYPLGNAIRINNPLAGTTWCQTWANMAISGDGLFERASTGTLSGRIELSPWQTTEIPGRSHEPDCVLTRTADTPGFEHFTLTFRGLVA